jgi:MYXO-CTERM domain-containing protein
MDWIERLLHVSPDGGSGALELIYLAVAAFGVVTAAVRRRRRVRSRNAAPPEDR